MSVITREQWASAFLQRCNYPRSLDNRVGTLTWIRAEWGGTAPIPAKYNPLSVVTHRNHSTNFNSVGVQNFETYEDGVEATALTLLTGDYAGIRLQLSHGNDDHGLITAIAASNWGSKPNLSFLQYTQEHYLSEALLSIGPAVPALAIPPENDMILCPNRPPLNGRQPYAVLDILNKRVLLFNGASLIAGTLVDQAVGNYRVWNVPSIAPVLGMDATRDSTTHQYDERGVVIGAADGGSFEAHWR